MNALKSHAGESFAGDLSWTSYCSTSRNIFKDGKVQEGITGCGQRYALRGYKKRGGGEVLPIPMNSHGYMQRFDCKCGALVSAWPEISNFGLA